MTPDELTPTFLLAQFLILALALAAAGWVLVRAARLRGKVDLHDVVRSGVWLFGATGLLTMAGLCVGVVHAFGVIRLGFLVGVLCIPLVGSVLLGAGAVRRVRLTLPATLLAVCSLFGAPLGGWMAWVEPYDLRVETAEVVLPASRTGEQPIRVGILADLQCEEVGDHERRAVAELMAQEPDLILIPGDIFQGTADDWEEWQEPLLELLRTLHAPAGVYFVPGDTDRQVYIRAFREHTDWHVLVNDIAEVQVRDRHVRIAGLANRASHALANELEGMHGDGDVRIVMGHAPDVVLHMRGAPRADLIVSGHTHGGQIVVPGFGPPMTLSHVPREMAAGGLHIYEGRAIYVSRGIGLERRQAPRVRLLCPPEVSIVTLRSSPTR